jgi:hypothetical protein
VVRTQHGWLVVAAGLAALGGRASADVPRPSAKLVATAEPASRANSEISGGLDLAQLQTSVLWKQYVAPLLASSDIAAQLNVLKARCKLTPTRVVTRISFGIKQLGVRARDGAIVAHGMPKAKLVACLSALTTATDKLDDSARIDSDLLISKARDGTNVAFSFLDDSTALVVVGEQATPAGVKSITMGRSALKPSLAFVELYENPTTADTLWLLMNDDFNAFDHFANAGIKPKAVFGSISVGVAHDIGLDVSIRLATADEAEALANMMQPQVQRVAELFDRLVVASDGRDVRVELRLDDAKLRLLATRLVQTLASP